MRDLVYFGLALLVAAVVVATSPQQGRAQEQGSTSRTVRVKVSYTGTGTVDGKHKIYVAIWNSPDFMTGSSGPPIAVGSATEKNGTVTITGVTSSPVYASAAYDPNGNWDGQSGPPPSGSSLGLYSKTPGKPEPIEVAAGKTAGVDLAFDDSTKMP